MTTLINPCFMKTNLTFPLAALLLSAAVSCNKSVQDSPSDYPPMNGAVTVNIGLDEVTKDYLEFDRMFYPLTMARNPLPQQECIRLAETMQEEHLRMTTQFFSLLPDADEVVRYLSRKYPLVVLSNGFVSVQYDKIERSGLRDCFADIVLSEEVGCQKPNPRIYEAALQRGGWRADEVLMIGDSWTSDIQGAIAAGIDQLWIHEGETDLPSTYKVSHLRDVMSLL